MDSLHQRQDAALIAPGSSGHLSTTADSSGAINRDITLTHEGSIWGNSQATDWVGIRRLLAGRRGRPTKG